MERLAEETPYEQMPYVCRQLARRAWQLADDLGILSGSNENAQFGSARSQLRSYFEAEIAPILSASVSNALLNHNSANSRDRFAQFLALPELAADQSRLAELQQICEQRRLIAVQERMHHWLHGWLLLHIPLSVALLVLGLTHVVASLYF
jgi:hypothetical protein